MLNSLLIVDDDVSGLLQLTDIIKSQYKIHAVKDGVSALFSAAKYSPDLILLDVVLPDMSGFEVLTELRKFEETRDIPVIFITGESESEITGLAQGAVDYIHKPFEADVVKLRVGNQIKVINSARNLEKAVLVAEAANRSKSSFLANVSHEIRTPMNAVLGLTKILLQDESLSNDVLDKLEKIYASSDLLLSIINDLLDFSKIEAGKLDIIPAKYNITSLVNDSVQLNMLRINNKPINFQLKIDGSIPAKFEGDELRIKQVLNNLLSNAIKYTEKGNVILSVAFADGLLELSVSDTGHGMTKEQLEKLFLEYARFEENSNIEGTGLGLTITRRLINLMHGEISVESEIGKGSVFTVKLPQTIVDDETIGEEVAENLRRFQMTDLRMKKSKIKYPQYPKANVLVVDDVETNIYVATALLEVYGLSIDQAANGREAIDKVESGGEYDIIFMDHMMPGMNGIDATKIIREKNYCGTIVALTANALVGNDEIFLKNGFNDFLSKPIYMEELNALLQKYLENKHAGDAEPPPPQPIVSVRFMESFIRDGKNAVNELERIYKGDFDNKENTEQFTTVTHGIKSALIGIGKHSLAEKALELEKSGRFGVIIPDIKFVEEIKSIVNDFEKILAENSDDIQEEPNLYGKLMQVLERCEDFDRKGALDILSDIKTADKNINEFLSKIKTQITDSEFEDAENAVSAYLRSM
jgi:signal transduction histidine kinase